MPGNILYSLVDVTNYIGQAGKFPVVNSAENGLDFSQVE